MGKSAFFLSNINRSIIPKLQYRLYSGVCTGGILSKLLQKSTATHSLNISFRIAVAAYRATPSDQYKENSTHAARNPFKVGFLSPRQIRR